MKKFYFRKNKYSKPDEGFAVQIENLCTDQGPGKVALSNISLSIKQGQQVSVVGPPHSGKTALLNCIAGKQEASKASICCLSELAYIEREAGYNPRQSVFNNVLQDIVSSSFILSFFQKSSKKNKARAKSALEKVGLLEFLDQPVAKLKSYDKQRLAIAKALVQEPLILLADNLIAPLEDANTDEILKILQDLTRELGITLIAVLPNPFWAQRYFDQIIWLEKGAIVYNSTSWDPWPEKVKLKTTTEAAA